VVSRTRPLNQTLAPAHRPPSDPLLLLLGASGSTQASFVIATIMPISTNTTIAICVQIQLSTERGDLEDSKSFEHMTAGMWSKT
jgi:hypothetical protein